MTHLSFCGWVVFVLFFTHAPSAAHAGTGGGLRIFSPLLGSEGPALFLFRPTADASVDHSVQNCCSFSAAIRLTPKVQAGTIAKIRAAQVTYDFPFLKTTIGRIRLRPSESDINSATEFFLLDESIIDGLRTEVHLGNVGAALTVAPDSAFAAHLTRSFGTLDSSLLLRWDRSRTRDFDGPDIDPEPNPEPRSASTTEAEVSLRAGSEQFKAEGIFQLIHQGEQRRPERSAFFFSPPAALETDRSLPRVFSDYRSAAQLRFFSECNCTGADSIILAYASRTQIAYFLEPQPSTSETIFQLTLAAEITRASWSSSAGLSAESSSQNRFSLLTNDEPSDKRARVRSRYNFWYNMHLTF